MHSVSFFNLFYCILGFILERCKGKLDRSDPTLCRGCRHLLARLNAAFGFSNWTLDGGNWLVYRVGDVRTGLTMTAVDFPEDKDI